MPVSPEWQATLDRAKQEGKVSVYLALAGFDERVKSAFEKAYPGIRCEVLREGTGSLITKMEAEREHGSDGADVAWHSSRAWFDQNKGQMVAPAGPHAEAWTGSNHFYDTYFTGLLLAFNIGFNPNVIKSLGAKTVGDWKDLLQPQLGRGLLGLTRPDVSPVYLQHFWLLDKELGSSFTEQLAAQKPRFYDSAGTLAQAVASGELAAGVNLTPVQICGLQNQGAPIENVTTARPQFAIGYWAGQLAWAKRPAAAQVFLDWLMSEEGQEALNDWGCSSSPMSAITSDFPLDEGIEIYDGVLTADQKQFQDRFNRLFGL